MKVTRFISIFLVLTLLTAGCTKRYHLKRSELEIPSSWPFYRGELSGNGFMKSGSFDGKLGIIWTQKSNDKPVGPLTIYNGKLIYPGARNKIRFYETESGKYRGNIKPKGDAQSGLILDDSLGFYANGPKKSNLKCINLLNGKILWQKKVKDALNGSIIVLNKLIIGSSEGHLLALDPLTGETAWNRICDSRLTAPPVYADNKLFLPGDKKILYVLDAENGDELNRIELNDIPVSSAAVSGAVFVSDIAGDIYSIDSENGNVNWRVSLEHPNWTAPAVDDHSVYLANSSGEVTALDKVSGVIRWKYEAVDVIRSSVLVVGNYLVFGTMSGDLICLNADNGSLVSQVELKGGIEQSPVTDGSRVFVATEKGMITCLGDKNEEQIN